MRVRTSSCWRPDGLWIPLSSETALVEGAGASATLEMKMISRTKKSETLQVRLPHGMKRDFMQRCDVEGRVASDLIRDFIESYLARPVEILRSEKAVMIRKRFIYPTLAAASILGAVVATLPTAGQARTLKQDFDAADKNADGALSDREWEAFSVDNPNAPLTILEGPKVGISVGAASPTVLDAAPPASKFGAHLVAISDQNGDGAISFQEYKAFRVVQAGTLFFKADADGDGQMTKVEFVRAALPPSVLRGKPVDHPVWAFRRHLETYFDKIEKKNESYVVREEYIPT